MNIDKLSVAISLNKQIGNVDKFLENSDSNMTINLTCGDSSTLTFTETADSLNSADILSNNCRKAIMDVIKSYKEQLDKQFEEL